MTFLRNWVRDIFTVPRESPKATHLTRQGDVPSRTLQDTLPRDLN